MSKDLLKSLGTVQGGPIEFYFGNGSMTFLKQHIEYFHFQCQIPLDLPV